MTSRAVDQEASTPSAALCVACISPAAGTMWPPQARQLVPRLVLDVLFSPFIVVRALAVGGERLMQISMCSWRHFEAMAAYNDHVFCSFYSAVRRALRVAACGHDEPDGANLPQARHRPVAAAAALGSPRRQRRRCRCGC